MRNYKNRSYCTRKDCKKFKACEDALTDAVHWEANMRNINISQFAGECFEPFDKDELVHNYATGYSETKY